MQLGLSTKPKFGSGLPAWRPIGPGQPGPADRNHRRDRSG